MPRAKGQASPVDCAPLPPFASPAPAPGPSGCQGATATRCQRCRCRCCRYGPGAGVSPGGARAATAAPAAVCATPAAPGRDDAPPAPPNPQRHSRCEAGRLTATYCTQTSRERFPRTTHGFTNALGCGRSPLRPTTRRSSTLPAPAPQASRRALRSKPPLPPPARRGSEGTHTGRCCRRLPTDSGTFRALSLAYRDGVQTSITTACQQSRPVGRGC